MGRNNKKFTYDYVKNYFEEKGCILISTEYINSSTPLEYICVCGEKNSITFNKFKNRKHGCKNCTGLKKYTQREVESYFEEQGCQATSEYKGANDSLEYICECGNPSITTFWNFRLGKRCIDCGFKKTADAHRHEFQYVKRYFESQGCQLISDVYISVHDPLDYICECGRPSKITFADFQNAKRCWECGRRKLVLSLTNEYDYVKNYFEEQDCILLEPEYKNAHQKLKYICECGNVSEISFDKFKSGQRCSECKIRKISESNIGRPGLCGEDNPRWNPNLTDEERVIKRGYPEYREWVMSVFKRDNFTCQCCGDNRGGNLNAHHKDGYHWCKERRLDLTNGVTLCDECHLYFHDTFGWKNNTEGQFEEFISNKN